MLKLTKTGIGLLTRQYRSVLKKCWLINVGIWRTAEDIISKTRKMMAYMLNLLDGLLNIKSNAFDEQSAKATATELPFDAPTVAGTFSLFGTENENVMDGLSEKRVFKTKLITSTAIGLMVAMVEMPSDAYAGNTGGNNNTASYDTSSAFGYGNIASGGWASAFGIANTVYSRDSSVIGSENTANGVYSLAFGSKNKAFGFYSSAFGYGNKAYGTGSSAFGHLAQAGNPSDTENEARYATAVGAYVQATGLYALALGNQSSSTNQTTASGTSAIAIGTGTQAVHDNSVAIGTNSVSAGANTISVGSSSIQRQIKYVAAGTNDTDAVNYSQIKNLKNYTAGTGITISDAGVISVDGGGSSVTLDTIFDAESTNGATSQAIANYLNNNYYRKNEKSGILNGVKEGKIGNEIGDNFSKSVQNIKAVNDNFATVENKAA